MNARRICPQCGLELPAGSSSWLCPKCVLAKAARGEDDVGSGATVRDQGSPRGDIADEALPRTLGNYQLLERIGEGGMGVVYRARQLPLDRIVAVKVLPFGQLANKEFVHRFRTEAVAAGSLQHPNIVGIHEVGLDEGQHYLVMEYVAGPTLAEFARKGPLPARQAARYVQLIAEAVHFAHERNILHRDLKPSNVLIDALDQPRVMDFGLAKRLESGADLTLSGQVLGSPGYMPPEQASGQRGLVGRRSDVYSLGAILYHLLTGRSPFVASELADTLRQVLNDEPVAPKLLNPKTPKDLETICLKCLEKEPAQRYPTAHALAEELGRFLRDEPILSRPVSRIQKTWRWCRRKPALAGLGLSAVVLLLALGIGGPIVASKQHALAERNRRLLYASDLKVAHQAWELGSMARAVELLERNRPQPGQTDLREFTWHYLRQLCEPYLRTPTLTHGSPVFMLTASNDRRWVAASGAGAWVTAWNLADPPVIRRMDNGGPYARPTAVSPDNRLLACLSGPLLGPYDFNVWDLQNSVCLYRKKKDLSMTVDFSPDGILLAAGQGTDVVLLDVRDWHEVRTNQGHWDKVWEVRFSPDGRRLASCGVDRTIRLWDVPTGQSIRTLEGHDDVVYALSFAPDGQRLVSASADHSVRLWDIDSGNELDRYSHAGPVMGVDFSPDGVTVASGSHDGLVKVWDLTNKQIRTLRGHSQRIGGVRFVLGGSKLVSGSADGTLKLWDLKEESSQNELEGKGTTRSWSGVERAPLAFSPDGSQVFTISSNGSAILMWQTASGTFQRRVELGQGSPGRSLVDLAVSSRDGTCAVACEFQDSIGTEKNRVELWNITEDRQISAFPGRIPLSFSPNGAWLVMGGIKARTLQGVNLVDGRGWTSQIDAKQDLVDAVVFSPDGRLLAACCEGELVLLETESGRHLAALTRWTNSAPINALALAPDGNTLAVGRFFPKIELWDLRRRRLIAELPGHLAQIMSLAVSPDGKTLASGDQNGALKLWSLERREELLHLQAHSLGINSLVFSPDLEKGVLASGGEENIVRLWRTGSRHP